MTTQDLVRHVREYLDAETARDARRAGGRDDQEERDRLDSVKRRLVTAVNGAYPPSAEPLMTAAREYLHAEEALDRCRSFGVDLDHATRQFDRARGELTELVVDADRRSETTAPHAAADASKESKRVLVAVDDTKPAEWAVQVAARYARDLSAGVLLLHVVRPEQGISEDFVTAQRLDILHRRQGMELLDRLQQLVPSELGASRMLRVGLPAEEIVRAAREWDADLVVIGTRGRGRVAQFVLGSTAEAVIRHARCPVLTVGHDPSPGAPGQDAAEVGVAARLAASQPAHVGSSAAGQ